VTGATVQCSAAVAGALADRGPVVALESSVLAQGLPIPENRTAHDRMVRAVAAAGATPAVTAVVRGTLTVGLEDVALERFLARTGVRKASTRDLPAAMAQHADAATTVASAMFLASLVGIDILATGGLGGVHHGAPLDESADLIELARTPVVVVCAGVKSVLDLPATLERLETFGVPVVGYRTDELPGFFTATTGLRVPCRVDTVTELAAVVRAHRSLGRSTGLVIVQPPPEFAALSRDVVDAAVTGALGLAAARGIRGAAVTPFLLDAVAAATGGATLIANLALLEANAALAGDLAVALARL
jgi:pseudouridine-5'-phosphate glycosidase